MPKRIGYVLYGHHNDSYMLQGAVGLVRCPQCGELLDRKCPLNGFVLAKKRDVSATYDGYDIVSQRFLDVWTHLKGEGLQFTPLPSQPGFFLLNANDVLAFDAERRQTRFERWQPCCGVYHSVAGATPAYLKHPDRLAGRRAFRSDVMFGSGDEKSPLILLPLAIGDELKAAKLTGIDLADILD